MKQAHKKRPPRATANSPLVLADMGGNYFINLTNLKLTRVLHIQFIYNQHSNIFNPLIKKQYRNKTIN